MTAETAAASNVRVYVSALERLGYDTEVLLKAAGLQRADVNDPDGCIPCSCISALFQRAMKERPLSNLGMRIAAETPIGAYPLIDYLVVTALSTDHWDVWNHSTAAVFFRRMHYTDGTRTARGRRQSSRPRVPSFPTSRTEPRIPC